MKRSGEVRSIAATFAPAGRSDACASGSTSSATTSLLSTPDSPGVAPDGIAPLRRPPFITCRSEEHTSELQSLMRISYAVFCLKQKNKKLTLTNYLHITQCCTLQPRT